jgi:hypothetical protein
MIDRFRAWLRWKLRIGWIYTGTSYQRCEDGYWYFVQVWLNVHSHETRREVLCEADAPY